MYTYILLCKQEISHFGKYFFCLVLFVHPSYKYTYCVSLQVLSWLTNKGEHALVQHADLANSLPAIRQQEQDFEKFYFVSMVSNGIAQ